MRQNETGDGMDEYERQLREEIAFHQRMYQSAIEPLVKQLVRIQAIRPRRMYITPEQAEQLGLLNKK